MKDNGKQSAHDQVGSIPPGTRNARTGFPVGQTTAGSQTENAEPTPLDVSRALALLREVVAERPDYVYEPPAACGDEPQCRYVWDSQPSCIVGHVLARAGVPIERIAALDSAGAIGPLAARSLCREDIDLATVDGARVLSEAQLVQDRAQYGSGETWADALAKAEKTAVRLGMTP